MMTLHLQSYEVLASAERVGKPFTIKDAKRVLHRILRTIRWASLGVTVYEIVFELLK